MVSTLLSEEKVLAALKDIQDPDLHKSIVDTGGIREIKIKEEKGHVSLKIALARTGTAEQMHVQQQIVQVVKEEVGAETVGLRFEQLSEEEVKALGVQDKLPQIDLSIGEVVKIKSGLFENFTGTVQHIDQEKRKLKVFVSMFSRETLVELDFEQVEKFY